MQRLIVMVGVVMALAAAPMSAAAQSNPATATERLQLSRRFIQLIQSQQIGAMIGQMSAGMAPERAHMTAEQQARFDHAMEAGATQMMSRMFDELTPVYAEIFTVEELRGLVGFYESDIGKSMMRKSRLAGPKMMETITRIMPELMTEMGDAICDDLGCSAKEREEMLANLAAQAQGGGGNR